MLHAREEPVTVPLKEGMKLNLTAAVDNAARLVNTALDVRVSLAEEAE